MAFMNIANFTFTYINYFIFVLINFIKCIINVTHLNIVIMFTYLLCMCLCTDCAVHGEDRGLVGVSSCLYPVYSKDETWLVRLGGKSPAEPPHQCDNTFLTTLLYSH